MNVGNTLRMSVVFVLLASAARGQLLVYSFTGLTSTPTQVAMTVTGSTFTSFTGAGAPSTGGALYLAGSAGEYFQANSWNTGTNYFEFTITPVNGELITVTSLSFGARSSVTGPNNGPTSVTLRSSVDGYASALSTSTLTPASNSWTSNTLTMTSMSFTTAVTFRIYGAGATSSAGTLRIDDVTVYGSPIPEPSTYAAIAGGLVLGGAIWSRRRQKRKQATPLVAV